MGFDFTAGRACTAASGRTKAPAGHRDNCSRREPEVIAAATETPRGERSHAVGAHVAEGHGK